jgi:hypothetical protein
VTAKPTVAKPTVAELGIDLAAQTWHRSGSGTGAIEVAFARVEPSAGRTSDAAGTTSDAAGTTSDAAGTTADAEWILMRVAGDPGQRVLVFDRHEWECFLDGARNGEFDAAADPEAPLVPLVPLIDLGAPIT